MKKLEELYSRMSVVNYLNKEINFMEERIKDLEPGTIDHKYLQHALGATKVALGEHIKSLLIDELLEFLSLTINVEGKDLKLEVRYDEATKSWVAVCPQIPSMLIVRYSWLELHKHINIYLESKKEVINNGK